MKIILETERLRLRELLDTDAPALRRLNDNPNVYQYTGDGPLPDDDAARALLETVVFPQYREHGVGRWAVERKEDGAFLGWCGLKWVPERGYLDLGYRFFEEFWGHGYATESARACVDWARSRFKQGRIVGRARVENGASLRVLEKIGLRLVGRELDLDGQVVIYETTWP